MDDVILVPLAEEHLEMVRAWRNSPEIGQYMFTYQHISAEDQVAWFNRIKEDSTQKHFVVEYGDKFLGVASLSNIDRRHDQCVWGFYLAEQSVRGAGIGSKMLFRLADHAFREFGLHKLYGEVLATNQRALATHRKFGFHREGYLRDHIKKDEVYIDTVVFGLLRKDWQTGRPALFREIYER